MSPSDWAEWSRRFPKMKPVKTNPALMRVNGCGVALLRAAGFRRRDPQLRRDVVPLARVHPGPVPAGVPRRPRQRRRVVLRRPRADVVGGQGVERRPPGGRLRGRRAGEVPQLHVVRRVPDQAADGRGARPRREGEAGAGGEDLPGAGGHGDRPGRQRHPGRRRPDRQPVQAGAAGGVGRRVHVGRPAGAAGEGDFGRGPGREGDQARDREGGRRPGLGRGAARRRPPAGDRLPAGGRAAAAAAAQVGRRRALQPRGRRAAGVAAGEAGEARRGQGAPAAGEGPARRRRRGPRPRHRPGAGGGRRRGVRRCSGRT